MDFTAIYKYPTTVNVSFYKEFHIKKSKKFACLSVLPAATRNLVTLAWEFKARRTRVFSIPRVDALNSTFMMHFQHKSNVNRVLTMNVKRVQTFQVVVA
jgi:hypothetical protein